MSRYDRLRATLELARRPGVVDTLALLRQGPASTAQLAAAGIRRPTRVLRQLAAAGCIRRSDPGSWDQPLTPDERFELTDQGARLAELVTGIYRWGVQHLKTGHHRPGRHP